MRKQILALILMSSFMGFPQAQEISYQDSQAHILELDSWARLFLRQKSGVDEVLEQLSKVETYGQSLADLYEEQLATGLLQPYSLNLLSRYFKVVINIHNQINNLDDSLESTLLKSLSLESLKKINDLYFHPTELRRLMNDQFATFPQVKHDWNLALKKSFSQASRLEARIKKSKNKMGIQNDSLLKAWEASLAAKLLEQGKGFDELTDTQLSWRKVNDSLSSGMGSMATGASSAFGAIAGNIAWREGYLKNHQGLLQDLKETLLPFDLLMEKKAYKFTDITIPGHWGHVGVYLGSKEQLQELGLWDHPSIAPFKDNIEKGKRIFQVRRWGLVFDTLEDFVNLDEMAILRVEDFTKKKKEDLALTLTFLGDQLNKSYDFSFDAMTGETITCTEIIAFSYGAISWPMEELLGRLTLSPNNLAELAFYKGTPLKTIMYATGDKQGLHYHSEEDFGKTLQYYKVDGQYQKHSLTCKRDRYRHRSGGLRWRYSCDDIFTPKVY